MSQKSNTDKNKKEKKHDFVYENDQDYVKQQTSRARILLWSYIGALFVTALGYLAFHLLFYKPPGPISSLEWHAQVGNKQESIGLGALEPGGDHGFSLA